MQSPARPAAPRPAPRIALAGEALIDFARPDDARAPLVFQGHVGGSPLNAAIACARLGAPTAYLTQLSTDLLGEHIAGYLRANGVDDRWVTRSSAPTTAAFVERGPTTNRYAFLPFGSADSRWAPEPPPELPPEVAFLHFGSISLLQEPAAGCIERLVRANAGRRVVVLDPNVRPTLIPDAESYRARCRGWFAVTDLLKLSDEDLAFLAPGRSHGDAAAEWLALGPKAIVVTRGGEGATLYRRSAPARAVAAPRIRLVDTIGAGDTFTAGLSVGLLERGIAGAGALAALSDRAWDEVLAFAAAAAALDCTRPGCDPPRRDEVERFLASAG